MGKPPTTDNSREWPDWLRAIHPLVASALTTTDSTITSLVGFCAKSHIYNRLGQIQANVIYDKAIQTGSILPDGLHKFKAGPVYSRQMPLHPNEIRIPIFNWAQSYHQLNAFSFSKNIICLKLVDGIRFGMQCGNLLLSMTAMRSILEQVGQLHLLTLNLSSIAEPTNASESITAWQSYSGEVTKRLYATRIDWTKLATADIRSSKAKTFQYRKDEYRADMEAADLLKAIDRLDQRIPGARLAYDVLSEFVHPNYGTVYAVTELVNFDEDHYGIGWQKRQIGMGFPHCMTTLNRQILVDTFLIFAEVFALLIPLHSQVSNISDRLLRCIQQTIRPILTSNPALFERNESCPCGSGRKLKKCCGQADS